MNARKSGYRPSMSRIFLEDQLFRIINALDIEEHARCLNLGCGIEGRYADLLASFDVDGVDILDSENNLQPWRYHQCDAKKLPFANELFDICIAIESFEHIEDNLDAMREVCRTLKTGGVAIITTPTQWIWIYEFGKHGPHYCSREKLIKLAEDAGLKCCQIAACGGFLFYVSGLLKSWTSPLGLRIFGRKWWILIDGLLLPLVIGYC